MKNCQLVEFVATVAAQAQNLIHQRGKIGDPILQRYWVGSRARIERWRNQLRESSKKDVCLLAPLIEDIFIGEMLARVWGAVLSSLDRVTGEHRQELLARRVLLDHLEIRKSVLELMLLQAPLAQECLAKTDRLRRRIERWTDFLLGGFVDKFGVSDYAFDPDRAAQFGEENRPTDSPAVQSKSQELILLSLRLAFAILPERRLSADRPLSMLLNSIINSFPNDPVWTTWSERIEASPSGDQVELLESEIEEGPHQLDTNSRDLMDATHTSKDGNLKVELAVPLVNSSSLLIEGKIPFAKLRARIRTLQQRYWDN